MSDETQVNKKEQPTIHHIKIMDAIDTNLTVAIERLESLVNRISLRDSEDGEDKKPKVYVSLGMFLQDTSEKIIQKSMEINVCVKELEQCLFGDTE